MGDGFEFTPPPRREARTFEPPPWEREAFEELRRKREAELAAAAESESELVPERGEVNGQEGEKSEVSEGQVVAMLAQLAAQEPDANRPITTVAFVMASICGVFGLVLLVWGGVALASARQSGRVGMIGGSLFIFVGIAAILFALWLSVKTLRQRGVL